MLASFLLLSASHALALSPSEVLRHGHSHNDYQQQRPLVDALANGFASVEADIWYRNGDLWISHSGFFWQWKGTLRGLYLDPLQKLVDEHGSVYGDGHGFILWLDIKDGSEELRQELRRQLARYPMLSEFGEAGGREGAVTVILTGNDRSKKRYVDEEPVRRAIRDDGTYGHGDPDADTKWRWYGIKWSKAISWNGHGQPEPRERARLAALVAGIHAKHKQVRFWKMPSTPEAWRLCIDLGVDQLSIDDLPMYREFSRQYGLQP